MPPRLAHAAVLAFALSACQLAGKSAAQDENNSLCPPETDAGPPVTFVSWNTGLAPNAVAYAKERVAPVAAAIAQSDAEFLCVQGVWLEEDVSTIVQSATARFPFSYHVATAADPALDPAPACAPEVAAPLAECVTRHCAEAPSLASCTRANCRNEWLALSEGCRACLAGAIGLGDPKAMVAACETGPRGLAYGGRNGVILLSKHALSHQSFTKLDSCVTQSVALHALAQASDTNAEVYCVNLEGELPDVPCPGQSWDAVQATQIAELVTWIHSVEPYSHFWPLVFGDLNCGPDRAPSLAGTLPANFQTLMDAFAGDFGAPQDAAPFAYLSPPQCTRCAVNPLADGQPDAILDHVLLSENFWPLDSRRVFDAPLALPGIATPTALSHHFGVQVTLERAAEACE